MNILRKAAGRYVERFIFIKEPPHNQLYPVIQHADFVIFPSLIDNFSNACIEEMYFERVVIGTDGTSFEQLIDDGKSGQLCKPNDADSLLKKMNEAATMNELQKIEMGKNARKRIDRLAPEFVVKKLLRYYQYIIDNTDK
ncbi:MAG: glycosyltransferase family 4 protein [Lachnospiraceae bacterium]|nr:glycosyltransferase family 4 protein [Lachnospiraceae bacterium]